MKDLVVQDNTLIGSKEVPAINARDLHGAIGSQREFSHWIKHKIKNFNLKENEDFIMNKIDDKSNGRPRIDYIISIESALKLCLDDTTPIGLELKNDIINYLLRDKFNEILNLIKNIDLDIEENDLFVYIVKEDFSGRYKIGISKNPENRVKQLNIGNPENLELVYCEKAKLPNYQSEKLLHDKYRDNHIRSEWFDSDMPIGIEN